MWDDQLKFLRLAECLIKLVSVTPRLQTRGKIQIWYCGLGIKCRLRPSLKMQTVNLGKTSDCRPGLKCRPCKQIDFGKSNAKVACDKFLPGNYIYSLLLQEVSIIRYSPQCAVWMNLVTISVDKISNLSSRAFEQAIIRSQVWLLLGALGFFPSFCELLASPIQYQTLTFFHILSQDL